MEVNDWGKLVLTVLLALVGYRYWYWRARAKETLEALEAIVEALIEGKDVHVVRLDEEEDV